MLLSNVAELTALLGNMQASGPEYATCAVDTLLSAAR